MATKTKLADIHVKKIEVEDKVPFEDKMKNLVEVRVMTSNIGIKRKPIRLKTFGKERKKIKKLVKEEKFFYPRKLRVSQEDIQKRKEIKELKRDLRDKKVAAAKEFGEKSIERTGQIAARKLKQKAVSRRVLKRGRAIVVVRGHEPAPYVPIFFKR